MSIVPIRVIVAHLYSTIRLGLVALLLTFNDITLVGETQSGLETLELCATSQPDVVLTGMVLSDMDGEEVTRAIRERHPRTQVIALTHWEELGIVQRSLAAGANGVFLANMDGDQLINIIRRVKSGKSHLNWRSIEDIMQIGQVPTLVRYPGEDLTNRETEVLGMMALGLTNPQIGERMYLSRATVKVHVSSILSKLGVSGRTEAVSLAFHLQIIHNQEE